MRAHNAVHVEVEVIKLHAVWIGVSHLDGYSDLISLLILDFEFLRLFDMGDCVPGVSRGNGGAGARTDWF